VITVEDGQMRFVTHGEVVMNELVGEDSAQAIPPGLDHLVEFEGPVHFSIDYLCLEGDRSGSPFEDGSNVASDYGGESACFAHLVCTVCGAVIESENHSHRPTF
jgi:hypothetical protein